MNDPDISKLDVRSLSLDTLQEILKQLLKLDNVAKVVSGVLTQSDKSETDSQSPLRQKDKLLDISSQVSITHNVLDDIYLDSLEVELKAAPFELVRNKPAVLFLTDLQVSYNNKYQPYPFEAFKNIKRALDITNELTGEAHNGVVIQRIEVNSQLFWTDEDLHILKKDCPVSKLSVGSNKTIEFCNKKHKGGRCPNYQMEMKSNSVLTIPHIVLQQCEHRIARSPNKKDKSFKYTLTFITINTDQFNSSSSDNIPQNSKTHNTEYVDNSIITVGNDSDAQGLVTRAEGSSNTTLAEPCGLLNTTHSTEEVPSLSVKPPNTFNSGRVLEFANRDVQKEKIDIANPKCPFIHLKNTPFDKFSYEDINDSTHFTNKFSNRNTTYYGDVPYNYTGGQHPPKQISENGTLVAMESMVAEHFPQYTVNSVTVNQYVNGNFFIPYHSDNEDQIVRNSVILTMSFGESRTMQFQKILDNSTEEETVVMNGDVVLMSMASQKHFKHGIKLDANCKGPRISVTWRLMKTYKPSSRSTTKSTNDPTEMYIHDTRNNSNHSKNFPSSTETGNAILLGDSMLSHLSKFSHSFDMKNVLNECVGGSKIDDVTQKISNGKFQDSIKSKNISHVFLCVGTNDLGAGYSLYTILPRYEKLINLIKNIFPNAKINIFNVFPRKIVDHRLTETILRVNNGLFHMCRLLRVTFIKFFYSFLKNGFLNDTLYFKDLLHFSDIGLQMIKRCILDTMNNGIRHMPPRGNYVHNSTAGVKFY